MRLELAHHDYETAAAVDIKKTGAAVYADHAHLLCLSWQLPKDPAPSIWRFGFDPDPTPFLDYVENGGEIAAWNSHFEENIWARTVARLFPHWPRPRPEQFHDIMAWALRAALPGALGSCAKAMGLEERKDYDGHNVMMQLSRPRHRDKKTGEITWWRYEDAPEKYQKLWAYCKQDVATEKAVASALEPLPPKERRIWLLDQKINHRGIRVDVETIKHAQRVADEVKAIANTKMEKVTAGKIKTATNPGALVAWLREDFKINVEKMRKADVRELLERPDLPKPVRRALKIRQGAGKTSVSKLKAMLACVNADGRVRGQFQYRGATTGRWAGRKCQPQNMPTPKLSPREVEECAELFGQPWGREAIDLGYGKPLDVISWCLRGMFVPDPGHRYVGGDFANIEGRMLAWLAGETWKLDAFSEFDAGRGPDLYKLAYGRAFGIDPNEIGKGDPRRQIGKVMELALGYEGGIGAFRSMSANYDAKLDEIAKAVRASATEEALAKAEKKRMWLQVEHGQHADLPPEIYVGLRVLVDAWRAAHPAIKAFWRDLEECAISAVKSRGERFTTQSGKITYVCGQHFLYCRLPSGNVLHYARPSVEWVKNELTGDDQQKVFYYAEKEDKARGKKGKKSFTKLSTYGGHLSENVTQGASRDVLADAMIRMDDAGYDLALHVHDEARAEVPYGFGSVEECTRIMGAGSEWAVGLPIAVECEDMRRYHK